MVEIRPKEREMKSRKAVAEFREYRRREMIQFESDFDRAVRELTEATETDKGDGQ